MHRTHLQANLALSEQQLMPYGRIARQMTVEHAQP